MNNDRVSSSTPCPDMIPPSGWKYMELLRGLGSSNPASSPWSQRWKAIAASIGGPPIPSAPNTSAGVVAPADAATTPAVGSMPPCLSVLVAERNGREGREVAVG
jgi:hypothetical protein